MNVIIDYINKWKRESQNFNPEVLNGISFFAPMILTTAVPMLMQGVKYIKEAIDKRKKKKWNSLIFWVKQKKAKISRLV